MYMKDKLNFRCCQDTELTVEIPLAIESTVTGKGYVNFGVDNLMPQVYYDCYNECSVLQSIINTVTDYVLGDDMEGENPIVNRQGDDLRTLLTKAVFDYIIFGAFSLQVIRNGFNKIAELNYIDVRFVRLDETGEYVYYSKTWSKYCRDIKKYDRFNTNNPVPNSIFYFKNFKSRGIYGTPIWASSLREVLTLIEASKINFSSTLNHFAPTTLINFSNGIPSEDVQDEIESRVIAKFTGAEGNNIMLNWSDDKEHAPEIMNFDSTNYTDKYTAVVESCKKTILVAFRCNGQLVGLIEGQTGFNDVEFTNSFVLFKQTVINPLQREIEKAFKMLGFNFNLIPFEVKFVDNGNQILS